MAEPVCVVPNIDRTVALDYACRLAIETGKQKRVYYAPCPSDSNPKQVKWTCRAAEEPAPAMGALYCIITSTGEVLHSYDHILHPFVGKGLDSFCKICKMTRLDRVHSGPVIPEIKDFLRWQHPMMQEVPVDRAYGEIKAPYAGLGPMESAQIAAKADADMMYYE